MTNRLPRTVVRGQRYSSSLLVILVEAVDIRDDDMVDMVGCGWSCSILLVQLMPAGTVELSPAVIGEEQVLPLPTSPYQSFPLLTTPAVELYNRLSHFQAGRGSVSRPLFPVPLSHWELSRVSVLPTLVPYRGTRRSLSQGSPGFARGFGFGSGSGRCSSRVGARWRRGRDWGAHHGCLCGMAAGTVHRAGTHARYSTDRQTPCSVPRRRLIIIPHSSAEDLKPKMKTGARDGSTMKIHVQDPSPNPTTYSTTGTGLYVPQHAPRSAAAPSTICLCPLPASGSAVDADAVGAADHRLHDAVHRTQHSNTAPEHHTRGSSRNVTGRTERTHSSAVLYCAEMRCAALRLHNSTAQSSTAQHRAQTE